MPATLLLTFAGLFISLVIAVPLGIVSAIRRYSLVDNLCTMFAVGGQAMPIFWLGIMLIPSPLPSSSHVATLVAGDVSGVWPFLSLPC